MEHYLHPGLRQFFKYSKSKQRDDGVVVHYYEPTTDLFVDSLNIRTFETAKKKVTMLTVHENVVLYRIYSKADLWEPFLGTADHGYIVFDSIEKTTKRVNVFDLEKNKKKYLFVQLNHGELVLVSLNSLAVDYIGKGIAFDLTVEDNETFCINDGIFVYDTVALIRVLSNKNEVWSKMSPTTPSAITNFQDMSCYLKPKQDTVYTLYMLSLTEEGREKLRQIVPEIDKYVPLTKDNISKLFLDLKNTEIFDKLVKLADDNIKLITMGLLDFASLREGEPEKPKVDIYKYDDIDEYNKRRQKLSELESEIKKKFTLRDVVISGARGNFTQVRQILNRGYVADYTGAVHRKYITSGYLDGLTQEETVISSKGTRKALIDQNTTISKSGYMNRKLCFSSSNAKLVQKECSGVSEDKYLFKLTVPEDEKERKTLYNCLQERYVVNGDSLEKLTEEHLVPGQDIVLRSPLNCTLTEGNYCTICYPLKPNSMAIGLIAAQSISERTTQLSLRTFHTGGAAKDKVGTGKSEDITNVLKYVATYFDKTHTYYSLNEVVRDMYEIWRLFSEICNLQLIHLEVVTAERLYAVISGKDNSQTELSELGIQENERIIPWKTYLNWRKKENIELISYKLIGVKVLPILKSRKLGLLFENPCLSIYNMLIEKDSKNTVLDRLYLLINA